MNKKLQRKIDNFNKKLQSAIDEMDGNNEFYYPAGDSIIGETDPINPAEIKSETRGEDDGEQYTLYVVKIDDLEEAAVVWDDGTEDFDNIDESISYLNRRIKRTLKLWQMDGDAIDKELEKDSEDDSE